jgi:hypothetical protein
VAGVERGARPAEEEEPGRGRAEEDRRRGRASPTEQLGPARIGGGATQDRRGVEAQGGRRERARAG